MALSEGMKSGSIPLLIEEFNLGLKLKIMCWKCGLWINSESVQGLDTLSVQIQRDVTDEFFECRTKLVQGYTE